jgi:hypothetical protein
MDGNFMERFSTAVRAVYTRDELAMMVQFRLNVKLDDVSRNGTLELVVFDLIQWAAARPQWANLPIVVAEYKLGKNARVPELDALRAEFEKALAAAAPKPAPAAGLPAELTNHLRAYEAIPQQIADGPARLTLMAQTADRIRATLPLAPADLPDQLHLSESAGERLAAVLALERTPDPRYLRWLAERVGCEHPFVGLSAALALTSAAYVLTRPALSSVKSCADASIDLLANDPNRQPQQTQLAQVSAVVTRRNGLMNHPAQSIPAQNIPFDEVMGALVEAFRQPVDLQSLIMAQLNIAINTMIKMTNRLECIVYYVVSSADVGGWDGSLIKAAATARPESGKLKALAEKYALAG